MRRPPAPALAALLTAVLLTGCSGGDSDTSADSAAGGGAAPGALAAAPQEGAEDRETAGRLTSARIAPGDAVIRTAELSVRVDDVRAAADRAAALARRAGGSVASEERSSSDGDGRAVVVLRVPPQQFDPLLDRLAELGEERSRSLGTTDVSDQVVDLDARIATQRASVARVRALLDRSANLGEVVEVEGQLTKRTADLESLEARLAALEEQVDLSTVTLRLDGEGPPLVGGGPLGFGDGLSAGWEALRALGRAAGVTAGALLPFSPLLAVGAVLLWRSRARRAAA